MCFIVLSVRNNQYSVTSVYEVDDLYKSLKPLKTPTKGASQFPWHHWPAKLRTQLQKLLLEDKEHQQKKGPASKDNSALMSYSFDDKDDEDDDGDDDLNG